MKGFWLYLISITVFFTVSCNNDDFEEIRIHWVVLSDISKVDFEETPIKLYFSNANNDKIFQLLPNKTEIIKIPKGMYLWSQSWPMEFMMYIYPAKRMDEYRFRGYGAMEIFIYNHWPTEKNEYSITLLPNEKFLAYHLTKHRDNMVYTFFSRSNRINLNISEVPRIDVEDSILLKEIMLIMETNNLEAFYFSRPGFQMPGITINHWGFIVDSKLNENGIIMLTSQGN